MPTLESLKEYIPLIDAKVAEVIDEFSRSLPKNSSKENYWALETIKEYCLRPGKHIRGSLAAAAYDHLTKKTTSDEAVLLAVAVEFMHNYLLIVDDVMDQSSLRRGKPTVHKLYQRKYRDASKMEADMMGINVGLLTQHLASLVLARLKTDMDTGRLEEVMHRNIALTGLGQIDDMFQTVARLASPDEIIAKYEKKSSYYTFVNPLECAYALAGEYDDAVARDCFKYGMPAGVAFQLRDDYVGVFGDSKTSGKENLDDIHEGKNTLLVVEALESADIADHDALLAIVGNEKANAADLVVVQEIMQRSGAVERVTGKTDDLVKEAVAAATSAKSWDGEFAEFLVHLIEYSVRRDA